MRGLIAPLKHSLCALSRRHAACVLVGVLLPGAALPLPAQMPAPPSAPLASSQSSQIAPGAKASDIAKEALVFDRSITRIRMEADGTGTRQTTARVRILADAGVKAMAVLSFTYTASNQQVDVAYVRVKKPDGSVVVTPDYNMQDMPADVTREAPMYSDVHQKHVAVRGLGVGDTLEYEVTLRTLKPEVPGHFWLEYNFEKNLIVLDEQLHLDLPAEKQVTVASADLQPAMRTESGRKLYDWASSNLSRPDPDAPPKSTKHIKPSVQVTTFTSWEQVGAWYQSLQHDSLQVTPALQAKADALTKGLSSDEDKIHAIFNDVALHIHYVGLDFGIGRYQPHAADDVLSNEYGDCKDKHTLLAVLLKAEGIEAWPVLISTARELDPATPSPGQFDHVITLVPLNGKMLWMDSTEEIAPVGTLVGTLRDKRTLAVPVSKSAYLERTPADLPYQQYAKFEVEGKLSDEGVFTGHFVQSYHGDIEMLLRGIFRSVPQSQWKELVQRFSYATGFSGEVQTPDVSPIEQTSQPLQFSYDYKREKYGEWDDRRFTPPFPPIGWEIAPGVKQIKPADDVEIGSPGEQAYHGVVQMPKGWSASPPAPVDLREDWAEYHATYKFKDGTFTADRKLVIKKDKVPLDQWDKYVAFRRSIYDDAVRTSSVSSPGSEVVGVSNLPLSANNIDRRAGDLRASMAETLKPLHDATEILETEAAPTLQDAAKAEGACETTVNEAEAKSLTLAADDPHSLYWAQVLAAGWTCLGWAKIESKELGAAEIYLRPAWRLSQSRLSGYELARALEGAGKKLDAAHMYQLASIAGPDALIGDVAGPNDEIHDKIFAGYKRVTGRELNASSLNRGQYNGSLRAELDKELEVHQLTRTSKITGSGLFTVAFEAGKPARVILLKGDSGMDAMTAALQAHAFLPPLPTGSKARLLREVRLICTPWAGCDAYLLLPTAIELPNNSVQFAPQGAPPGTKTIRIEMQPQ